MEASVVKFLNALYSSVDPNWKPTDNVPDLAVEGFKEFYPILLALMQALKQP